MSIWWTRIKWITVSLLVLVMVIYFINYQHTIAQQHNAVLIEMKQLREDIARAQTKQVTPDQLKEFARSSNIDLQPIQDDLATLHAQLSGIASMKATTSGFSGKGLPSSNSIERTDPLPSKITDQYGYLTHTQSFQLSEPAGTVQIPIGKVDFQAWQEKPWSITINPRQYSVVSVLGQDDDGHHYVYHKFNILVNGQTYPVQVSDAKLEETTPSAQFRFNPRIFLALDAGGYFSPVVPEVLPNLQVSLFSYGVTRLDSSWSFLGLGFGYATQTKSLGVILTPVRYNVAKHLPFVQNIFIGPSLMINSLGQFALLGGISVGL